MTMEFANKEYFILILLLIPYIVWYLLYRKKSVPSMRVSTAEAIVTDTVHGVHVWCTFRWCCIASATHCSYAYWLVLRHVMRGILSR